MATTSIDQELVQQLRHFAHAAVFSQATDRAGREAFELVQQIREEVNGDGEPSSQA